MTSLALVVAAILLALVGLTYTNTRNPAVFLPRMFAASFSLEIALIGLAGAILGTLGRSAPVAVGYGLVALAAGVPVARIWSTPEVLSEAFGENARMDGAARTGLAAEAVPKVSRRYQLRRPWGLRLPRVPAARLQQDIPFWTPPEGVDWPQSPVASRRSPDQPRRPLRCDIWQPPTDVPPSGLGFIYFHGSAWAVLDKDFGTRTLFRHLAAQGHTVMDVAYRLFPETDIEGMVGDVRRAIAWFKANAATYNVDPHRIVTGGGSAGGHIALLAAYTEGQADLTPLDTQGIDTSVRGVLTWYGPADLRAVWERCDIAKAAAKRPDQPDWSAPPPPLMRRLMGAGADRLGLQHGPAAGRLDWILGGSPAEQPARYALLSPIAHVHHGCPPTLMMQGPIDIIVPVASTIEVHRKLRQAGVKAALLVLPHTDHGLDLFWPKWSPAARKALWHAERFLELMARR